MIDKSLKGDGNKKQDKMAKSTHETAKLGNEKSLCTNMARECKLIAARKSRHVHHCRAQLVFGRAEQPQDLVKMEEGEQAGRLLVLSPVRLQDMHGLQPKRGMLKKGVLFKQCFNFLTNNKQYWEAIWTDWQQDAPESDSRLSGRT